MAARNDSHHGDFVLWVVVRPLLFVFWSLVLWGTFYGAALLREVALEGPTAAIQRALSGKDAAAAHVNLALVGLALFVWSVVALACLVRARARRRRRASPIA